MQFQPFPLAGEEAVTFLKKVETLSSPFKTRFVIDNGEAVIMPFGGK